MYRDVKLANILSDVHHNAYLSDFGLVKVVTESSGPDQCDLTTTGIILGTPGVAAPEI